MVTVRFRVRFVVKKPERQHNTGIHLPSRQFYTGVVSPGGGGNIILRAISHLYNRYLC